MMFIIKIGYNLYLIIKYPACMCRKAKLQFYRILFVVISIPSLLGCTAIVPKKVIIDKTESKTDIELQRKLEEWAEQLYSNDPTIRSSAAVSLLGLNLLHAQEPLVKILKNGTEREDVQISVIKAFGFTRDDRATEILIDLLNSESAAIQTAAAEALEMLNTRNAIRKMSEALIDPHRPSKVRILLAEALGNTNDRDAVDPLIRALTTHDYELREVAMTSLSKITKQTGSNDSAWWKEWWHRNKTKTREQWLEDILSKQEENTRKLESKMGQLRLEVAQKTIKLLELRSDKTDSKLLIDALQSEYSEVRIFAAKELTKIKDPSVMSALSDAVTDKEEQVRIEVVQALGETDNKKAIYPLTQALHDESFTVREKVAKSLGKLGKREAEDTLILALRNNTHLSVLCTIIESLGQLGGVKSVEPLIAYLTHKEPKVRECTAVALGKIRDARAVEPLIIALGDEQERVRWYAADSLGKIGDPVCVDSLIKLLSDSSARVRESAIMALEQVGNQQAIDSLIKALQDVDRRVAEQAAESLISIKKMDFDVMDTVATTFFANKDYKRAEIILGRQIAEFSSQPEYKEEILQSKIKLAKILFSVKELEKALNMYEELIKKLPNDDTIKSYLIQCLKEIGQFDRALEWYSIWIKETPQNKQLCWQGRLDIANTLFEQGKYEQVKNLIHNLQTEDPNFGEGELKHHFQRLSELNTAKLVHTKTIGQKFQSGQTIHKENKKE
ncbi:MAG: hypothetical protein E3K32_13975 [wastewater metagenome]|nr:hypothetical protein [Candidatus Loosdrechtia aerotolerans]